MNKLHILGGALLFAMLGTGFAYIVGTGFLSFWRGYNGQYLGWLAIVREYPSLRSTDPRAFQIINLIWAGFVLLSLVLAANVLTEKLPTFGTAHWQSRRELKKNGFLEKPGRGFVVGKTGSPEGRGRFLCSAAFPHCLLVAPTGAGKGISFVIPNLLLFQGSAVVLDVKGENFELTSRHRQSMGDKIWRFAPLDWENPGHRYNPLDRINALPNPDQRQMELRLLAELFLEAEDDGTKGLLEGGIDLFVACGIYAIERGIPTLGEIYRLASAGGDKQKQYMKYADDVQSPAARLIFERLASTNDRTLTSYLSLLMTSGLSLWSNPAIDRATETSDFSFRDFRRFPQSAYFIAPPHNKMTAIAPLVRLFFSDLLSSLHDHLPGQDEPWRVMIMLDEFDMLGRMPSVTDSIKTLRAYGGHLAVVTQTIPALDKIYGEDTRLSLQGGAGVKIYLAPAEQRTKAELSAAVGKTTVRVTSKSRTVGKGPFNGINISERHEERDLLTEDEAGRLKKDEMIILANGHHPIKAWRISYFDDKVLKPIFEAQKGPLPGPDPKDKELRSMRGELMLATNKITELAQKVDAVAANRSRVKAALPRVVLEQIGKKSSDAQSPAKSPGSDAASPKADSAAPLVLRRQRDLSPLVGSGLAISTSDAAVRVMVDAAEKVRRISSGDEGYALEAG